MAGNANGRQCSQAARGMTKSVGLQNYSVVTRCQMTGHPRRTDKYSTQPTKGVESESVTRHTQTVIIIVNDDDSLMGNYLR